MQTLLDYLFPDDQSEEDRKRICSWLDALGIEPYVVLTFERLQLEHAGLPQRG